MLAFFAQRKAHRSGPYSYHHFLLGVVPGASVSRRQSTDDSQCKKHIRLAMPLRIGFTTPKI
jgi:hypothetical protein